MPGASTPAGDGPFGYNFSHVDQPDSSYPPAGPPLLDNNESSLLDSFFNDPNNIDPTFLSLPSEFQADPANVFTGNPVEWPSQGVATMSGSTAHLSPNPGQQQHQRAAQNRHLSASAEVYAAAEILRNNNSSNANSVRQSNPSVYNSYGYSMANIDPEASQLNGFGVPSLPNNQVSEYDFGEGNNGYYNGFQDPPNPYAAGLQNRLRRPGPNVRPAAPLNFGSDDNFRESAYVAQSTELPDQKLVEAVDHAFGQDAEGSRRRKDKSSHGQVRKRRRQSPVLERKESGASDSNITQEAKNQQRGGEELKEEENEGECLESGSGTKRGRKKVNALSTTANPSDSTSTADPHGSADSTSLASPSKKQKAGAANLSKERRENLSEEQKRSNHILSEQKRRNLIKQGFEDLNNMVPELRSNGLSKSNMLMEAARFMRKLRHENDELRLQMEPVDNG